MNNDSKEYFEKLLIEQMSLVKSQGGDPYKDLLCIQFSKGTKYETEFLNKLKPVQEQSTPEYKTQGKPYNKPYSKPETAPEPAIESILKNYTKEQIRERLYNQNKALESLKFCNAYKIETLDYEITTAHYEYAIKDIDSQIKSITTIGLPIDKELIDKLNNKKKYIYAKLNKQDLTTPELIKLNDYYNKLAIFVKDSFYKEFIKPEPKQHTIKNSKWDILGYDKDGYANYRMPRWEDLGRKDKQE